MPEKGPAGEATNWVRIEIPCPTGSAGAMSSVDSSTSTRGPRRDAAWDFGPDRTWRYLFRAIDQFGRVIDVFVSPRRDRQAASRSFAQAIGRTRVSPTKVTTRYRVDPHALGELLPAVFHHTEAHANDPLQTDHGRIRARLRPMRGLKRDRTARVIVAGHAFVQNLRRGFYDLGTDVRPMAGLADAFAELALVI